MLARDRRLPLALALALGLAGILPVAAVRVAEESQAPAAPPAPTAPAPPAEAVPLPQMRLILASSERSSSVRRRGMLLMQARELGLDQLKALRGHEIVREIGRSGRSS